MEPLPISLVFAVLTELAHSHLEYLNRNNLQCRQIVETGKTEACFCNGCPGPGKWCPDDWSTGCGANELFTRVNDFGQRQTGGQCQDNNPYSYPYRYRYDYKCCTCPPGYKPWTYKYNTPVNCDPDAYCAGCIEPGETLVLEQGISPNCIRNTTTTTTSSTRTAATPQSATPCPAGNNGKRAAASAWPLPPPETKNKCPGLQSFSDPVRLRGSQLVISTSFAQDIRHLVACAASQGGKAGLDIQSASRCSVSKGLTPAKGIGDHQLGRAVDANLVLPDGTPCDRDCMALGYCAFHPTRASCVSLYRRKKPTKSAKNAFINGFLERAGRTGMQVGATFLPAGDWNHFERDVADLVAAFREYQPQLRNFCNKKCGSEGLKKMNPSEAACNCPGYRYYAGHVKSKSFSAYKIESTRLIIAYALAAGQAALILHCVNLSVYYTKKKEKENTEAHEEITEEDLKNMKQSAWMRNAFEIVCTENISQHKVSCPAQRFDNIGSTAEVGGQWECLCRPRGLKLLPAW